MKKIKIIGFSAILVLLLVTLFLNVSKMNAKENTTNEAEVEEVHNPTNLEKSPELSPEEYQQLQDVAPEGYELVE